MCFVINKISNLCLKAKTLFLYLVWRMEALWCYFFNFCSSAFNTSSLLYSNRKRSIINISFFSWRNLPFCPFMSPETRSFFCICIHIIIFYNEPKLYREFPLAYIQRNHQQLQSLFARYRPYNHVLSSPHPFLTLDTNVSGLA